MFCWLLLLSGEDQRVIRWLSEFAITLALSAILHEFQIALGCEAVDFKRAAIREAAIHCEAGEGVAIVVPKAVEQNVPAGVGLALWSVERDELSGLVGALGAADVEVRQIVHACGAGELEHLNTIADVVEVIPASCVCIMPITGIYLVQQVEIPVQDGFVMQVGMEDGFHRCTCESGLWN